MKPMPATNQLPQCNQVMAGQSPCHSSPDRDKYDCQTALLTVTRVSLWELRSFTFGLQQGLATSEQAIANAV